MRYRIVEQNRRGKVKYRIMCKRFLFWNDHYSCPDYDTYVEAYKEL